MICIVALIIFGILGIFSASYRKLAKEAFDCVFRRITFRKCRTDLDRRMKSQITGKVMRKSQKAGRFLYRHFEVFSWIFLILMVASLVFMGIGFYNYLRFGNCNGPESDEFCIFRATGLYHGNASALIAPHLSGEASFGPADAPVTMVEFGCFSCPYTKRAAPVVEQILQKYQGQIRFYYLYYPIQSHRFSFDAALAGECAREQGKFWEGYNALFALQPNLTIEGIQSLPIGVNRTEYLACLQKNETRRIVEQDIALGKKSGVYGTPTFFINGVPLVGPKSFDKMDRVIRDALAKQDK